MMKKKREELKEQLVHMKPGKDIQVAKGIEITISRLAVNQVLEKKAKK